MTDTNNTWPGKPGVPLNPEKDGWHWLSGGCFGELPTPHLWSVGWGKVGKWVSKPDDNMTYLRPCLTPDEVQNLREGDGVKSMEADEITRLRAQLATAQEYRDALNEALASRAWLNPIQDDEKPKDALDRLLRFEVAANLDPETSEHVADLVHAARREGMEEAAKIAADFETVAYQHGNLPANDPHECAAQTAREIAASIRAAAGEGK